MYTFECCSLILGIPFLFLFSTYPLVKRLTYWDKEDDQKAGVKSTALLFGDSTKQWTTGFAIACIAGFALSVFHAGLGWAYYVCLAAAAGHLAWQIWTVDLSSADDFSSKFVSNQWFGAIVFGGTLAGRLLS
ncbi:4-hydroxybenzoate polyprenyltransferase, mitochondrial [Quillaja saponaria]|uniref:4-hydroxybenzoate polyprenyltransferase, mitochondrial n=1 Tax=Quillaja saponaria TaxID=32244 RepID=A0AAD7M3B0_QUISA|nr:4-hydroxybenzoate polyprenyltransferase, mitochondrial [Quillaja saponaria]